MKVIDNKIDTLIIGYYADVDEMVLQELEKKKTAEHNNNDNVIIELAGFQFYVRNHSAGGRYSYILDWKNGYNIKINKRVKNDRYPNVRVRISSYACHNMEYMKILYKILSEIGQVEEEKVSEVHLAVDTIGFNYDYDKHQKYTGCPRSDSLYRNNREITSAYIGSMGSQKFLRIYNKTNEINQKQKGYWLYNYLREEKNVKIKSDIWRFEFQLRRKFIKEFSVNTYQELEQALNAIWRYLTKERINPKTGEIMGPWVAFKDIEKDKNITRCPVLSFWEKIQDIVWNNIRKIKTRIRDKKINVEQVEKQAMGCISTIMSSLNLEGKQLMSYLLKLKRKYKDEVTEDIIKKKVQFQL